MSAHFNGIEYVYSVIKPRDYGLWFHRRRQRTAYKQVICSLLIYMIIAVIDIIKEKKRVDISANIQYSLSEQSFKHLMKIKADYFTNRNYAEILNNINVDIGNMTSIADEGVFLSSPRHSAW